MVYKNPIQVAGSEEKFVCPESLVLNTYKGCGFECSYCYAKWLMERFGNWKPIEGASILDIKKQFLKAKKGSNGIVSKLLRKYIPLRFGNLTDPFQPIEKEREATYKALKFLNKINYPVIINTKGVIQAEDKYLDILEDMKVVVQETIISDNPDLTSKLEGATPTPKERINAIEKIADRGIPVQVRYSPVFPLLNDEPEELFRKVAEAGANDIISEYIRIPTDNNKELINEALGYDYLNFLQEEDYPIVKRGYWYKVKYDKLFEEYRRHKKIAESYGLDYLICCEEKPEINDWRNCCGVEKYGFNSMDWTIQMRGKKFSEEPTSFLDYMEGACPYTKEFLKYWNNGKLEGSIKDLEYNNNNHCYKRCKDD